MLNKTHEAGTWSNCLFQYSLLHKTFHGQNHRLDQRLFEHVTALEKGPVGMGISLG